MRTAQAHAPVAYHTATPGLNWQRPLVLVCVVAFSVLVWGGIAWGVTRLF